MSANFPPWRAARVRAWGAACAAGLCFAALAAAPAENAEYRFSAPIRIEQPAAFVRVALPPNVYAHSQQSGLRDLRVVDSAGERVPFALLEPRSAQTETHEQLREAAIYPLPPRPAAGKVWPSPLEVIVQGDRISVQPARGQPAQRSTARSPGWLVDLGEAADPRRRKSGEYKPDEPQARALHLVWSGPAEFSVGVDVELSDDLRQWRRGASSQVLALSSATGSLTQPRVPLPATPARFVRLVWNDAPSAPVLSAVKVVLESPRSVPLDAPTEVAAKPLPAAQDADPKAPRALVFDLGGALPLHDIELRFDAGTQVAPVRVQGRRRTEEAWTEIASTVFYRIERAGQVSTAPPLKLHTTQRLLRVIPDERAAPLDPARLKLVANVALASLVFVRQGREPYSLQAGSADAKTGALPVATLVPALSEERQRFGVATLGEWRESESVARRIQSRERLAALRPWLLWAVLLAGVAGLGFMVWRLARKGPARA